MTSGHSSTEEAPSGAPTSVQGVVGKISALIAALAVRSESPAMFYKRAAAAIVHGFQCPFAMMSARFGAEIVDDYWHTGSTSPNFWKKPVEELLNSSMQEARPFARRFSAKDASFQIALISVILRDINGSMIGVMSMVVRCSDDFTAPMYRELLESFTSQMAIGAARITEAGKVPDDDDAPDASLSKAASYTSGVEMAFALVSSLRGKLGCEQAAIGMADGSRVKIKAVSGLDEVSDRAEAVRLMGDAMGEALDRGSTIVYQNDAKKTDESDKGYRIHRRWSEKLGGSAVATIPLETGDGATMVVSLRRRPELPFNPEELQTVETLMQPYAPAFGLIDRANRSLVVHTKKSLTAGLTGMFSPRSIGRKCVALCLLALTIWIAFGSMGYRVNATATVRPTAVRSIAAPVASTLENVFVTVGDRVTEGQLLAVFETSDLLVQREQFLAEERIARINEDRAISEGDGVQAQLARAEQSLARARIDEINRQIERSTIIAPYDGLVMTGDLRGRIGETMSLGTAMFEIAKEDGWTVDIEMPQRIASELEIGHVGNFAPNASPEDLIELQLTRIQPMAVPVEGKTVYIAEGELTDATSWVKPGMEGVARVEFGERPVWWVLSHRTINYFRTNFWL